MSNSPAAASTPLLLPAPPRLIAIAIVLSFAAGATDAFAFLQLGGIFTANMTGNMILMGLVQRPDYLGTLFGGSVAIVAFAVGVYAALRVARPGSHRGVVVVLALTAAAQVLVLIGWHLAAQPPSLLMRVALIVISTLAMAGQTSVARRIEVHSGVTTTFATGTLTSLMAGFADRRTEDTGIRIGVIVALILGGLCGAVLVTVDPRLGAALPIVPTLIGLAILAPAPVARPVAG